MDNIDEIKKDLLMDPEESGDRQFAKYLGISYDELKSLSYEEEKVITKMPGGGEMLSGFRITFQEDEGGILAQLMDNGFENPLLMNADHYISMYEPIYEEVWEFLFEDVKEYSDFVEELDELEGLLDQSEDWNLQDSQKQILYRQAYIGTFAALETCLQDTLMNLITNNERYKVAFIRSHPDLSRRKITFPEFLEYRGKIDDAVKEIIESTIYHKFSVVKNMYEDAIGIDFPPIQRLYHYLPKRHDIVHRNGKTKNGRKHVLELEEIMNLITDTKSFIIRLLIVTDMYSLRNLQDLINE